jgi:hypothetical protein
MQSSSLHDLATLAREAHARTEQDAADELRDRIETREHEMAGAALRHLRNVLGVEIEDVTTIEDVHAEPFDTLGGWARMNVDGIVIVYDWAGPDKLPTLAVQGGDGFDTLAGLGAALARLGEETTGTAGITTT